MAPSHENLQDTEFLSHTELMRHAAWIRRLALGLVGDSALAEDVVQDTWLAALRRPPSGDRPLRPWLKTVVRNVARQAFRGEGRRARRQAEAGEPAPVVGPEELAERLELERGLTDELARLEEPFRSTLMLRYYEGHEPSEIARRQNLPAGTVRWRVKRGLAQLRERLDQRFEGRAQWSVLFLSLARPDGAPTIGVAAAAFPGAMAMHASLKFGVGAAALVALAVGLRLGGALPESMWPFASEAPAVISMRPFVPALEPELVAVEPAPRATERQALVPTSSAEPRATEEAQPAVAAAIEVRVVDEQGAPIQTAWLRIDGKPTPTLRDRSGTLRLEFPEQSEPHMAAFTLGAPGFASRAIEAVVTPGATAHLGTLVLSHGGVVSGVVRSADGLALAEAVVTFTEVDIPRSRLRQMCLRRPSSGVPEGRTRPDGSFTVEGVSPGYVRAWAWSEGFLASYSGPLEVRAGQESYGLELVLTAVPAVNRIAGVVLDPDGAPVPGARLEFLHRSDDTGTSVSGDETADANGRFEFLVPEDAQLWLTAHDPEERFGPGSASAIETAAGELVLWLSRQEHFELRAVDSRGQPVTVFAVQVLSPDGEFQHQDSARAEHADGRVTLRRPTQTFKVRVNAPGHDLALVGPHDPASLPEVLSVVLTPLGGVQGVVRIADQPASGVLVRVYPLVPANREYVKDGFRSHLENAIDTATTDADGRFLLTPRQPGGYVVRADHAGFAPAVSEPFELGSSLTTGDLELILTSGGTIEGRVIQMDGSDPAGTIVGLSRADTHDRTVRVGRDGSFRFEHLTPGSWLLVERDEEIQPGRTTTSSADRRKALPEIEWTCRVYEGQTTRHDLVLGAVDGCVLRGRLTIEGSSPIAWSAMLLGENEFFADDSGQRIPFGPDGTFLLRAREAGRYRLVLNGSRAEGEECFVLDLVDLQWGEVAWELDLVFGSLLVTGVPAWSGESVPGFVHIWEGLGHKRALTVLAGDPQGQAELSVPAGKGRIVRPDPTNLDIDSWPTSVQVDVPRAGQVRANLP